MKKKILILAVVLVAIIAMIAVNAKRGSSQKGIPVTLGAVKSGPIVGKVSGPGKVNPEALVDISAHLPGKITRLAVHEGDPVAKGQLLLELDRAQYEARLEQARANVESMKSQVDLSRAQEEKAELDLKRAQDLHERGVSSESDLDLAKTSAKVESARLGSAQQNYEQALASCKAAQDDLDKCRYLSPMDGVVSRLNVEEGEIAITGTMNNPGTVLLSIADMSRMEVEAEIDETDVVDVKLGQKVKIKVDAIPDTSFVGSVTEIANTAVTRNRGTQEEVTNFTVKAVFAEQVAKLRPGMSATVEVETAARDNAVKAPIQAIVSRNTDKEKKALESNKAGHKGKGKGKGEAAVAAETEPDEDDATDKRVDGVYLVRDGRAEFVPVKTGISDERFVEITTGLAAGDKVVTGPYQTLRTMESGKRVTEKKDLKTDGKGKS